VKKQLNINTGQGLGTTGSKAALNGTNLNFAGIDRTKETVNL